MEVLSRVDGNQWNDHILGQMNDDDCTVASPHSVWRVECYVWALVVQGCGLMSGFGLK